MSKIVLTDEASTPSTPAAGTTVIYTQGGAFYVLSPLGTPSAPITSSLLTATGDMIYASAPGTAARRAIGTSGQFLSVAGGLPVWTTLFTATTPAALGTAPAAGSSTEAARRDHVHQLPVSAAGDLMYANGATTVTNLAIGASGRFLRVNGGGTAPEWATATAADVGAVPLSTVTTAGDLIYGTGAGAVTRRGIGTVGQVLAVNAGATAPVWQSPPTFVAGPTSSTAQFRTATAIQDAITAAAAAISGGLPSAVVEVLPGAYTATLTVPANVSLTAPGGLGSVLITGAITVSSASGRNALSNLYVTGSLTCNAGGASTAIVEVDTCQFVSVSNEAVLVNGSGWGLNVSRSILNSTGSSTPCIFLDSTVSANFRLTEFISDSSEPNLTTGGNPTLTLDKCKFNSHFLIANSGAYTFQDCVFDVTASTTLLDGAATPYTINIFGSFGVNGLAAAGSLYSGLGTVNVSPGTALGSYQLANLPTLSAGSDGALAYVSDQNSLYVRRSAAWSRVALPANANTWTGTQTFNETVFNRAATPASANDVAGTYTFTNNNAPPLIRMTTGAGVQTVNLFAPAGGDVGKQWVIFDAGRNSAANNITINPNGTDTINGVNAAVTISTNGGALVFRVTAAGAWETIGY